MQQFAITMDANDVLMLICVKYKCNKIMWSVISRQNGSENIISSVDSVFHALCGMHSTMGMSLVYLFADDS